MSSFSLSCDICYRTIGPGKPKKATQSPVGLPSSASPAAPSPKDFNIDISNSKYVEFPPFYCIYDFCFCTVNI